MNEKKKGRFGGPMRSEERPPFRAIGQWPNEILRCGIAAFSEAQSREMWNEENVFSEKTKKTNKQETKANRHGVDRRWPRSLFFLQLFFSSFSFGASIMAQHNEIR